jgi:ribokinase
MRVAVVGSFMFDIAVRAPRRPEPGETVVGTELLTSCGGKGFNQAVAAARAGSEVIMVGRLGTDEYGRRFRAALADDGIDDRYVIADEESGTGVGLPVVEPSGENSIVIVPRANHAVTVADIEAAGDLLATSDVVLLQLELPVAAVLAAATAAHRAGATVVLNPAPAAVDVAAFAGLVDVLVPNRHEAAQLAGTTGEPDALGRRLRERTGATVVVTLGGAGVVVVDDDGALEIGPHAVPVLDTVGAGDAFCGTLGARLAAGDELRPAATLANAAGAIAVTRPGAAPSMPTAAEVTALLAGAPIPAAQDGLALSLLRARST